jgi:hypothetical protein
MLAAMNASFRPALLFALLPLGMAVLSDVLFASSLGVGSNSWASGGKLAIHAAFWAAVFLLSALGALLAFMVFRSRSPSRTAIFVAAQLFAIASFYVIFFVFALGSLWAPVAWLLFGAFLFAGGAAALSPKHGG